MALTTRALTALGSVLILVTGLWWSAGHLLLAPFGPSALAATALAGAAFIGALAVCLASGARLVAIVAAIPQLSHALAVRDKSWGAAFLRQCDPDAAGRPRPRAPSAAPAAALS
jgi:Family of unknown function (DUF6412)